MNFFLFKIIDVIVGNAVFISDHRFAERFLNFREFVSEGNRNNWLIAYEMEYNFEIKIVNKKHPKHKQIIKLINISIEHGIEKKWESLYRHGILMLFYLFKHLAEENVLEALRNEIDKKRKQITFDELSNVFLAFLLTFPISIIVFVLELITYKLKHRECSS